MSISTEKSINDSLEHLGHMIIDTIKQGKRENIFPLYKTQYIKWKLDSFEYTEDGPKVEGAQGEHFLKTDWVMASYSVYKTIEKTKQYKELINKLENNFTNFVESYLHNYVAKIARECFEESLDESSLHKIVEIFFKDLQGEPLKLEIQSELMGLILHPKSIRLPNNITLRQTQRNDLEKEELESNFNRYGFFPTPSAFLKLETTTDNYSHYNQQIRKTLDILRLFRVGYATVIKTYGNSESIIHPGIGTAISFDREDPKESVTIKVGEDEQLRDFYLQIQEKIPNSFGIANHHMEFSEIAYMRYVDALNKDHEIEPRIANTMMGLESIYLRDTGELQELSYRLRLRIAKIMSFFGYDPHEVRIIVRDGYSIRSKFVHGSSLSFDSKTDLEEKHSKVQNILSQLLDLLRISIVISLMLHVSKDEFVESIDKSFLDKQSQNRIEQIINPGKHVLGLS